MEYQILLILVIHVIQTYRETPFKIEKLFDIWRHFQRLRVFYFVNKKLYLCSHIAECADIAEFFAKKLSAILGHPCSLFSWK